MSDLYLIAHKVRGEPAFDVAQRMACPCCDEVLRDAGHICDECAGQGYWWIIPTSGHRAYPWWHLSLEQVSRQSTFVYCEDDLFKAIPEMPEGLPDHYPCNKSPDPTARPGGLLSLLGLRVPEGFRRRV